MVRRPVAGRTSKIKERTVFDPVVVVKGLEQLLLADTFGLISSFRERQQLPLNGVALCCRCGEGVCRT